MIKNKNKDKDLLLEATNIHVVIAKYVWQIMLQKHLILEFQNMDIDYDMGVYL